MYLSGQGVERNEEKAANWFAKAAAQGNARAVQPRVFTLQGDKASFYGYITAETRSPLYLGVRSKVGIGAK